MPADRLVGPGSKRLAAAADRQQHLSGSLGRDGDRNPPDLAENVFFPVCGHVPPGFLMIRATSWYTPVRRAPDTLRAASGNMLVHVLDLPQPLPADPHQASGPAGQLARAARQLWSSPADDEGVTGAGAVRVVTTGGAVA